MSHASAFAPLPLPQFQASSTALTESLLISIIFLARKRAGTDASSIEWFHGFAGSYRQLPHTVRLAFLSSLPDACIFSPSTRSVKLLKSVQGLVLAPTAGASWEEVACFTQCLASLLSRTPSAATPAAIAKGVMRFRGHVLWERDVKRLRSMRTVIASSLLPEVLQQANAVLQHQLVVTPSTAVLQHWKPALWGLAYAVATLPAEQLLSLLQLHGSFGTTKERHAWKETLTSFVSNFSASFIVFALVRLRVIQPSIAAPYRSWLLSTSTKCVSPAWLAGLHTSQQEELRDVAIDMLKDLAVHGATSMVVALQELQAGKPTTLRRQSVATIESRMEARSDLSGLLAVWLTEALSSITAVAGLSPAQTVLASCIPQTFVSAVLFWLLAPEGHNQYRRGLGVSESAERKAIKRQRLARYGIVTTLSPLVDTPASQPLTADAQLLLAYPALLLLPNEVEVIEHGLSSFLCCEGLYRLLSVFEPGASQPMDDLRHSIVRAVQSLLSSGEGGDAECQALTLSLLPVLTTTRADVVTPAVSLLSGGHKEYQ